MNFEHWMQTNWGVNSMWWLCNCKDKVKTCLCPSTWGNSISSTMVFPSTTVPKTILLRDWFYFHALSEVNMLVCSGRVEKKTYSLPPTSSTTLRWWVLSCLAWMWQRKMKSSNELLEGSWHLWRSKSEASTMLSNPLLILGETPRSLLLPWRKLLALKNKATRTTQT